MASTMHVSPKVAELKGVEIDFVLEMPSPWHIRPRLIPEPLNP